MVRSTRGSDFSIIRQYFTLGIFWKRWGPPWGPTYGPYGQTRHWGKVKMFPIPSHGKPLVLPWYGMSIVFRVFNRTDIQEVFYTWNSLPGLGLSRGPTCRLHGRTYPLFFYDADSVRRPVSLIVRKYGNPLVLRIFTPLTECTSESDLWIPQTLFVRILFMLHSGGVFRAKVTRYIIRLIECATFHTWQFSFLEAQRRVQLVDLLDTFKR